ncbi:MAG: hypothetical protein KGJ70_09945, partial [Gemmatimonadota bacterium]|nr:hypothetical protein [Gemmatimonadota bacterium]
FETPHDPMAMARVTRREFLRAVGVGAAALSAVALLGDCASSRSTGPGLASTGTVKGTVTDLGGAPQAVGRIYLLEDSGLNDGQYADVASDGSFDFGAIPTGQYQLRFWGADLADVPESLPNPVRITVTAGQTTVVQFRIVLGAQDTNLRQIDVGDYFFQEEPYGLPNGTVVVPLGTLVCWYNVGRMTHTVTGGPWGDSGPLGLDANFNWLANQAGTFPYRCTFHAPAMQAVLQVTA